MASFGVVLQQLDQERNRLRTQLESVTAALSALKGPHSGGKTNTLRGAVDGGRRKMSRGAIARIRAAQKKRWAKWKKEHKRS